VLFCDLVGSTEIAAQLDPEEWRELVTSYHHAAAEAITRYGGHVAKYLGDGVMAFFGYPEAHENDAERAARAGLAILEGISKLNQQSTSPKISVRVGIDSGAVVVGAGGGKEADVFGEAPNIAARVQTVAAPDTVLITSATHRLLSGLFVVEELGAQQLKGVASPVELYRVVRPTGVRSRIGVRGLTPFIGREEELQLLLNRWQQVREGEGQVVLVIGEAGIGKSRLIGEFHERIRDTPHTWVESAGEQLFENTPFHAVTEMLSQWLELQAGNSVGEQVSHLESALALAGLKLAEAAPLIGDLLQLPLRERYPALTLTPEQKRRRLLAALAGWLFGAARLQPVVMVVEDLHWLDPSTLDLQQVLAEQGATAPLMLLYTARPEFRAQWPLRAHHTQVTLNRLSTRNVRNLVLQVVAHEALSEETLAAVVERTGGIPLFVEELTRAVLEGGDAKSVGREIPVTLHDSLMARLDRLGPAKEIMQIAAVIGSEFSYELLHAVHRVADHELQRYLSSLTNADLLYVRGIAPDATYQFKHALIRDAAYEALLKSRRKELHHLVAHTIDEQLPHMKEAQPEVLARHWTEAGELEPAIAEWSRAGKAAETRNAFKEAQDSYQQALGLLDSLPESHERDLRELELRQAVVRVRFMTTGHANAETMQAMERAVRIAEKSGNLRQLLNLLIARGINALICGDLNAGSSIAARSLELGGREGSPSILGRAHLLQIMAHYYRGELTSAERYFVGGLDYFEHPSVRRIHGVPVAAFYCGACVAWYSGRADVAGSRMAQMLAVAGQNDPFEVAFAGQFAASLLAAMGEYEQAESIALHNLEVAEKQNFAEVAAGCQVTLGLARAQFGDAENGVSLIRQGIGRLEEIGQGEGAALRLSTLAVAQHQAGSLTDALQTIQRALRDPDFPIYRPEILRISGELHCKSGQTERGEAHLREAIALARQMEARSLELRAALALTKLLRSAGRGAEARTMLAEIYNWFTEGFNTADLKDAKALLDE
jgi:class 3 adenylate cyclase/tetratricopeptide (TPR) repeat protein